jgi:hypothetical protein
MIPFSPRKLIFYGMLLVLFSFVLAMLLFMRAISATFFLCFLTFRCINVWRSIGHDESGIYCEI